MTGRRIRRPAPVLSLIFALLLLPAVPAVAQDGAFVVEDVRVQGNERIADGTIFTYLPLEPGETLGPDQVRQAIRELYGTGFFRDVELRRDGNVLVVVVDERPSIARLEFEGNEQIRTEDLRQALRGVGLAEGRIFNRPQLAEIERELRQQYFAQGKYDVRVESTVSPLERNRVAIRIDIDEGPVAAIRDVHFTGNEAFSDRQLLGIFEQRPRRWWLPWSQRHRYSRDMVANDLENLRGHYLDRGYINFNVESTRVSISPDRRDVHIAVNVSEGEQYTVDDIQLRGELIVSEDELREQLQIESGELYARNRVNDSSQAIRDRLGLEGYAFAQVNVEPRINEEDKTVDLTFHVDPRARAYVRRINITGNQRSQDEVIRREMRQMEGAPLSNRAVQQSRTRLNRLGFFDFVNIDTNRVPGTDDQVDVDVSVQERMTGQLQAGVGYGDVQGVLLNFSVSQDNVLGTGDRASIQLNNSSVNTIYNLSYTDRYHTLDGVSRTLSAGYRETRARRADLADYDLRAGNAAVAYGIPFTEVDRINARLQFEQIQIDRRSGTPDRIANFLDEEGEKFNFIKPRISWSRDTRDRGIFPTAGATQELALEGTLPGADQEFYKASYEHRRFWPLPLGDRTTFSLSTRFAYGDGYGDTNALPFFEHYYAGGVRTVRGYRGNFLGPRDNDDGSTPRPIGGNARILTSAEVLFPPTPEAQSVRLGVFVDAGQVFNTRLDYDDLDADPQGLDSIDLNEMRAAAGVSLIWMSPVGPLTFSVAEPLNDDSFDETETFQFSLGTGF